MPPPEMNPAHLFCYVLYHDFEGDFQVIYGDFEDPIPSGTQVSLCPAITVTGSSCNMHTQRGEMIGGMLYSEVK